MPQNLGESACSDKPNQTETASMDPLQAPQDGNDEAAQKVPHDEDPSAFVRNLVGQKMNWAHERPAISWTMPDGRQPVVEWQESKPISPKFTHVSVGLFRINDVAQGAKFYRRAESWTGNLAIVLDDIGEEKHGVMIKPPKLEPTVIVETKPGSQQWWYVFKEPLRNASVIDMMMRTLVDAGYGDKGGSTGKTSLIRLARLPGSDPKGRGIPARIVFEDWRRRFVPDPKLLFGENGFNIPLQTSRPVLTASNAVLILSSGDDPLLDWLSQTGQTLEPAPNSQGWIAIRCPWHGEHTGGAEGGTGYRSAHPNGVFCFHGACAHRQPHDFFAHWLASGAPVLPEVDPLDEEEAMRRFVNILKVSGEFQLQHLSKEQRTMANAMPMAMALAKANVRWPEAGFIIADDWLGDTRPAMLDAAKVLAWRADLMMQDARAEYEAIDEALKETNLKQSTEAAVNAFLASMEQNDE